MMSGHVMQISLLSIHVFLTHACTWDTLQLLKGRGMTHSSDADKIIVEGKCHEWFWQFPEVQLQHRCNQVGVLL